jgi:hypothetical protein
MENYYLVIENRYTGTPGHLSEPDHPKVLQFKVELTNNDIQIQTTFSSSF